MLIVRGAYNNLIYMRMMRVILVDIAYRIIAKSLLKYDKSFYVA